MAARSSLDGEDIIPAVSTQAEAISTVVASGLVLTLASGSASRLATATIRPRVAATTMDTAIGSRLHVIPVFTRVTNRIVAWPLAGERPLIPLQFWQIPT